MKVKSISPNWLGQNIEDRRYCGKCGKVFSVFEAKKDSVGRIASPCCNNIFNNEIICQYDAKQDCPLSNQFDCGNNCAHYKEANFIK